MKLVTYTVRGTDSNALLICVSLPSHFISDGRSYDKEWEKTDRIRVEYERERERSRKKETEEKRTSRQDKNHKAAAFSSTDCGVSRPRGGRAVFRQVLTLTTPPHTRY